MIKLQTPLGRPPAHRSEAGQDAATLIDETFRLQRRLMDVARDMAAASGLTAARWQVLSALRDRAGTVSSIARSLGLTRQSVQRSARGLEADGFLAFSDNPEHCRADLASLTEKGVEVLEELTARQAAWLEALSEGLPPANIRIGVGMMRGLLRRLSGDSAS